MSGEVLAATVTRFLETGDPAVVFAWQGGEPTLAGLDFYRTAVTLQERAAAPGQRVANALQTNGVLIDERWATFLAERRFLVGLSIDGPPELHDAVRCTRGGEGSHAQALRAWQVLRARRCEVNVLTVVHGGTAGHATEVYRHLTDTLGAEHVQFIPHLPSGSGYDLEPGEYGRFLSEVFALWVRETRAVSVKLFDDLVLFLAGKPMRDCMHRGECDSHLVVERDGGVYPCDFFVAEEHRLGDTVSDSIEALRGRPEAERFRRQRQEHRPEGCGECRHFDLCQGGCARFWEGGQSRLCADTRLFLDQCRPAMEAMAARLRARWSRGP
jgi:uncharacterized protein